MLLVIVAVKEKTDNKRWINPAGFILRVLSPAPLTTWQPPRSSTCTPFRGSATLKNSALLELCDTFRSLPSLQARRPCAPSWPAAIRCSPLPRSLEDHIQHSYYNGEPSEHLSESMVITSRSASLPSARPSPLCWCASCSPPHRIPGTWARPSPHR